MFVQVPRSNRHESSSSFPCSTGGGKCEKNGVGYKILCEPAWSAQYNGDPGRNAYTRGLEHLDAFRLKNEESPLWKHCVLEHQRKMQIFE